MKSLLRNSSLALPLLLGGCTVGPNFKSPQPAAVDRYTWQLPVDQTSAADVPGGNVQRFEYGEDLPAQWWTLFQSQDLNRLVDQAIRHSPTLQAAQATLRAAQENLRAQRGSLLPAIDAGANAARQKAGVATTGITNDPLVYNVFTANLQVSYVLDLWGQERRRNEAQAAQANYSQYQLEAAYLTLTSNVVITALQFASLQAQLDATRDIIGSEEQQLQLIQRQFQLGAVPRADVFAAETQVAVSRANLPALRHSLMQAQTQLARLLGRYPSELSPPNLTLGQLALPDSLPVSLPSALARQRPDVKAQEALLHAASARIGIATADMLPRLTLTGSYGGSGFEANQVFDAGATTWSVIGGLTQPIFHAGSLEARRRAASAEYDASFAQYRDVVLHAFSDVANALNALTNDADAVGSQTRAMNAAQQTLALVQQQYAAGAVDQAALLIAQSQYQQSRIGYVQSVASRYQDTAALFVALGGGWWNRGDSATVQDTASSSPQHLTKAISG